MQSRFGTVLTVMSLCSAASAQINAPASIDGNLSALTDTQSAVPNVLPRVDQPTLRGPVVFESRVADASITAARLVAHGPSDGLVRLDLGGWTADAFYTRSIGTCGSGGSVTSIGSFGAISPATNTIPITPARRTSWPFSFR